MILANTDGACSGNPGPMGIGAAIHYEDGSNDTFGAYAGIGTNNQAEYIGMLTLLKKLNKMHVAGEDIRIRSDSMLVVNQLNGKYKVKNDSITGLYAQCMQLLIQLRANNNVELVHIPREQNAECDKIAKKHVLELEVIYNAYSN